MRRLSAYYIFPISSDPLPFGIIEAEDNGTIIRVVNTGGDLKESSGLEFYQGVLIPAVVFDAIEPSEGNEVCSLILKIQHKKPEKTLIEILKSLTLDAAVKISGDKYLGSLDPGKNPGIMLIDDVDLENMKLTGESTCKVLIAPGS